MNTHTILVAVHATAAVIAFLAGIMALRARRLVAVHCVSTALMTGALIGAVLVGTASATPPETIVFSLLSLLATFMSLQGLLAWRRTRARPGTSTPPPARAAIGFNCIGFATGFVAVSAIHLANSTALAVVASIATVAAGRAAITKFAQTHADPD